MKICSHNESRVSAGRWYIREMNPGDEEKYIGFLANWITQYQVLLRYRWLYRGNPHGKAMTWLAIESKSEKIIGCTSIFPKKMQLRKQSFLGCVGGDSYVDPGFRRMGIVTELHRVSQMGMRRAGLVAQYGFPVAANLGAFCKIGALIPGKFKIVIFRLRLEPMLKKLGLGNVIASNLSKVLSPIASLRIAERARRFKRGRYIFGEGEEFVKKCDKLIYNIAPTFEICCVRDEAYLRWRFLQNPLKKHSFLSYEVRGELHGYAAVEVIDNIMIIYDFIVRKEDEIVEGFIYEIVRLAYSRRYDSITMILNPEGPYFKNFLRCGFSLRHRTPDLPFMVLHSGYSLDTVKLSELRNWYITLGDTDT